MISVLIYILNTSFNEYNELSYMGVFAINLGEPLCLLVIALNFMALIKWKQFDIKYHTRITILIAFVLTISFNTKMFSNEYNDYLMIPLLLAAFLGFYFIYRHKYSKDKS